jgi:hypothetical protein
MRSRPSLACLVVAIGIFPAVSQHPDKLPDNPDIPTIKFECVWEAAMPQDYVIVAKNLGGATYLSRNPTLSNAPQGTTPFLPDYYIAFTLSPFNLSRIFKLTQQANYFNGDFDYKKHRMANTGTKTLTYADPARHFETAYNWSENNAIDQLTRIFEGISNTLEHGRKLEYLHRYDRLGLEAELKAMEDAAQSHFLEEIQAIRPALESIAGDSAVMNIARQRARRLLNLVDKEAGQSAGIKTPK